MLALAAVLLPLAGCDTADKAAGAGSAASAPASPTPPMTDASFLSQAAASGRAEIELGLLAARRGAAIAVRRLGQQVAREQKPLNAQIVRLATGRGLSPANAPDAPSQQEYDTLSGLTGRAFDRAYLQGRLAAQQEQLALFQGEIENGTDPEVKAFAARYIGVVQRHLEAVERLNDTVPRRYRAQMTWERGEDYRAFARRSNARSRAISAGISRSGIMFGPSEGAWSGSGCVSMNTAAHPTASAARASTGANSRWPPEDVPCPPGCCTEWVASNTTG
jgi:putative membrane protein